MSEVYYGEKMFFAAYYITTIMIIIALFHIYWALGGLWPGTSSQDLLDKVVGSGECFPGKIACLMVTVVFVVMALLPLIIVKLIHVNIDADFLYVSTAFFCLIFFIRGFALYLPVLKKRAHSKFNYLNGRVYSPLCISLGISELVILLQLQ